MLALIDNLFVKVVMWLGWKQNDSRILESISNFEATEDDSAWHLLKASEAALTHNADPKTAAQLFEQSLEESHHAEVFRALYKQMSGKALNKESVERVPLYPPNELWKLFVFCAVGEKSAAQRFNSIAINLPESEFKTSLAKIIEEESGHVHLAEDLFDKTSKTEFEIKKEMTKIKLTRASQSWMRIGRKITEFLSVLILKSFYYLLGGVLKVVLSEKQARKSALNNSIVRKK